MFTLAAMKALRRTLVNVTLMIVTVVVVLGIAEIALRVTGVVPAGGVHTVSEEEFRAIPGMFSPGQSTLASHNRNLPHKIGINSLGFRGRDFSIEKPSGEFRIVMIGDSFTFGEYVDDEQTLPARLEFELRKRCPRVRVINGGVGGTSIYDQRHIMERSLAVAPDVVVLMFYENDVINLAAPQLWDEIKRNRTKKSQFPYSLAYKVARSTALWNLLVRARGYLRAGSERADRKEASATDVRRLNESLRIKYADHLREFRNSLVGRKVPLVVTAFPSHHTMNGATTWEQIDWFAIVVADLDIQYIDIARQLAASGVATDRLYLMPLDGHASPIGYTIAARGLAEALLKRMPLASVCPSS